jgi:uncharacterized membrane protein YhaH (DUF805 family)
MTQEGIHKSAIQGEQMDNPYAAPGMGRAANRGNGDNPYAASAIDITELDDNAPYQPSMFSLEGRIGRWRYLGYCWGYLMIMGALMAGAGAAGIVSGKPHETTTTVLGLLCYLPVLVMARRRLHDLDHSGWWLLMFILFPLAPIIALYLTFGKGSEGSNRFGPPPDKNHPGIYLLVLIPLIGILAAVAIPAYQQYKAKTHAMQIEQQQQQPQ